MKPENTQVWVWAEHYQGKLSQLSLGLLGKTRELCQQLGDTEVAAVLVGTDSTQIVEGLISYGADRVYLPDDPALSPFEAEPCARFVASLARTCQPELMLWGATSLGREIAARAAAKLNTGLTAHCIAVEIEEIEGKKQLVASVSGWGGNATIKIICPERRPQMATVKAGIFAPPPPQKREGEVIRFKAERQPSLLEIVEVIEAPEQATSLEKAEVVIAGGWGMSTFGDFKLAEQLAQILGGSVGGTRPAVDAGWLLHGQMIGQSGVSVSPRLLVTLGVSGAAQFASTVLGTKFIMAVDKNPDAPIFEMADLGIVGDLKEVLPLLISRIKSVKEKK